LLLPLTIVKADRSLKFLLLLGLHFAKLAFATWCVRSFQSAVFRILVSFLSGDVFPAVGEFDKGLVMQ